MKIIVNNKKLIIGEIYRSPNSKLSDFYVELDKVFKRLMGLKLPIVLGGDFNIDLFKTGSCSNSKVFIDHCFNNDFIPTIFKPTRVTHTTSTLIDNIFVLDPNMKICDPLSLKSAVLVDDMSDHFPCVLTLPNVLPSKKKLIEIKSRKINKENILKVNHDVMHIDWDTYFDGDLEHNYKKFHDVYVAKLDEHLPITSRYVTESPVVKEPWYDNSINKSIDTEM